MAAIMANGGGIKFLKTANGKMYVSSDTAFENPLQGVEGKVVDMKYKVLNFNGADTELFDVTIQDEAGETFCIGFNTSSAPYNKLVSYLKSADLSKALELHCFSEPRPSDPEKFNYSFAIKQGAGFMKGFYQKGDLPEWNKVRVNGKDMWDREDFNNALKKIVLEEMLPIVHANATQQQSVPNGTPTPTQENIPSAPQKEEQTPSLPF